MDAVTYSLKTSGYSADVYYKEIRAFTEEVILKSADSLIPLTGDYISYLKEYQLEEIRREEEYILELLSFGLLWRVYAGRALRVKHAPFITLSKMSEWRKKHQRLKPAIDITRGILFTLFMLPPKTIPPEAVPRLEDIDHVCKWFEATGEFREQALRFIRWRAYWGTLDDDNLTKIFLTIRQFTTWFLDRSSEVLGKYTENVESFLEDAEMKYRWREDRIQCTRSKGEYHLNMVGAELMNRAFRDEYLQTQKKALLLPGCMRAHTNSECKAVKIKEGLICGDCTPECNVNRLRNMGKKYNFDVYIIPHASDLSLWSPQKGRVSTGIVATACVTTLVEGGWELKRYDVAAQCVLLDCSGCKKHWHSEGIPTSFNLPELRRLLSPEPDLRRVFDYN
jgi:uncharacterized protein